MSVIFIAPNAGGTKKKQDTNPHHESFRINYNESNSDSMVVYTGETLDKTPAFMDYTNGYFDYGSWENAWFMPKPCMVKYDGTVDYYLDPDDYTKKADGTASDVASTSYGGNAMMEWGNGGKKIYYKIVPDSNKLGCEVHIANYQVDDAYMAYSFINSAGVGVDHFYTPIYGGYKDSSGRMRSISGQALSSGLAAAAERTACQANNPSGTSIWDMEPLCDRILLTLLLVLMCKSTDLKTKFGNGIITGSETAKNNYKTGAGNTLGMFFGYSSQTNVVKTFGMENFWGLQWHRTLGYVFNAGTTYYKLCYGAVDGSTTDDYNWTGSGYKTISSTTPSGTSGSYISQMAYDTHFYYPKTVSGSATTYYRAGCWWNTSSARVALFGGTSDTGAHCSAFTVNLNNTSTNSNWNISAATSL